MYCRSNITSSSIFVLKNIFWKIVTEHSRNYSIDYRVCAEIGMNIWSKDNMTTC